MSHLPERSETGQVTVEDLLRLKRAERPSPEFWNRFEQDLRAKQLAAIIEKRPWWVAMRLPQFARYTSRLQLPLGAAAALALSFVVIREYKPSSSAPDVEILRSNPVNVASASPVMPSDLPAPTVSRGPVAYEVALAESGEKSSEQNAGPVEITAMSEDSAMGDREPNIEAVVTEPATLMAMIPWAAPRAESVPEKAVAEAAVGELPQVHFAAAVDPVRDHDFTASMEVGSVSVAEAPVVQQEETPVEQVSPVTPREVRRNRILSSLVLADNNVDGERSRFAHGRDILARSLDEDRIYDSVHRVGMGGDRLTLKF